MRTITIKDVALRAGVSPKTVSRVLNHEEHVRPEVRAAVQRIIADLDYRPNAFARSLSSTRSYLLGLLLDDPGSGYAADVQLGALLRCRERSYHLVVEPVDIAIADWASQIDVSLRALRLDGAILTPPLCDNVALLDLLDALALPYVRISPSIDIERSGFVRMDDHAAAHEMTAYLLSLGHTKIGFITGDPAHSASAQRLAGYRAALADAGVVVDARLIRDGDFSFRAGLALGESLLHGGALPSAIFASNDDMALGVLISAIKLGIAVPGTLSIAGFDDAPTSRAAWPQLTTIRQPKADMAAAAVDILVDQRYRLDTREPSFRRLLGYSLVIRLSTGTLPETPEGSCVTTLLSYKATGDPASRMLLPPLCDLGGDTLLLKTTCIGATGSYHFAPEGGARLFEGTLGRATFKTSGKVPAAIHVHPEAAVGGSLARIEDGDIVRLCGIDGTLAVHVDAVTLAARTPAAMPVPAIGTGRELFAMMRAGSDDAEHGASAMLAAAGL